MKAPADTLDDLQFCLAALYFLKNRRTGVVQAEKATLLNVEYDPAIFVVCAANRVGNSIHADLIAAHLVLKTRLLIRTLPLSLCEHQLMFELFGKPTALLDVALCKRDIMQDVPAWRITVCTFATSLAKERRILHVVRPEVPVCVFLRLRLTIGPEESRDSRLGRVLMP